MHQGAGANMHCVSYAVPAIVQLIDSCQEAYKQCCRSWKFTCSVTWLANPAHGCRVRDSLSHLIISHSRNLGRRISRLISRLRCIPSHPQQNISTFGPNISSAYAMSLANTRHF